MSGESTGKYLAFELGGQCFAVEVARVEVVLETVPITRVPKAPAHLRGVINYRGTVIPVADLRVRIGDGLSSSAAGTSIIVFHVRYEQNDITMGMLADSVHEVIELESARIARPPQVGSRIEDALIKGIGERNGDFIVVLDIDAAFKAEAASAERGMESR
jgi:purine-binding chemotaxis protein CheW